MDKINILDKKRRHILYLSIVSIFIGFCVKLVCPDISFLLFISICAISVLLLLILIRQSFDFVFRQWTIGTRITVLGVSIFSFFLLGYQNILDWQWAMGENKGQSIVYTEGKSWNVSYPVMNMHSTDHPEDENTKWPWYASLNFSNNSITSLFSRKISFYVTQPESGLRRQDNQSQYLPPKSGDGITVKFKYLLNNKWYLAQKIQFDAINDTGQHKWHDVEIYLPPDVSKLSIQVFPQGTIYNDSIWISPQEIIYVFPASVKLFLFFPILVVWSLIFSLILGLTQKNIVQKYFPRAIYLNSYSWGGVIIFSLCSTFSVLHNFSNFWQWTFGVRAIFLIIFTNVVFAAYYFLAVYLEAALSLCSNIKKILLCLASFFAAFFIAFVIPLTASPLGILTWKPIEYFTYMSDIAALWSFILAIGLCFGRATASSFSSVQDNRFHWLLLALPSAIIWTIWLLTFWPGIMNGDTYFQWHSMITWELNDWIPPLVIVFSWLVTRVWFTPGAIAFAQILASSMIVGWGLSVLAKNGLSKYAVLAISLLLPLLPANGTSVVLIGKDLPYSIVFLALTIILVEIFVSDGRWIASGRAMFLLVVISSLTSLFRHNGLVPAVGSILLSMFIYKQYRKQFLFVVFCTITVFIIVSGPVYDLLKVKKGTQPGFPILLHNFEAHIAAGTPISNDEAVFLNEIRPLSEGWTYNPYDVEQFHYPSYKLAIWLRIPVRQ